MNANSKIVVLGGGSWGATIASHLAQKGFSVTIWEFLQSQVDQMVRTRSLSFLPQLKIPGSVQITSDMAKALDGATTVFSVIPSQFVRATWKKVNAFSPALQWAVSLSKGIDVESLKRMSEVIEEECPKIKGKVVAVSGPSHAEEVAIGIPTAVVAACSNKSLAEEVQETLATPAFRVYTHSDPIGVEISGSLKNIFAIACGACDGLQLGDNTKSALITRGLNEMAKLGVRMGAKQVTFFGLAGMGDLVVTCLSQHSRNRLLGEKIGQGKSVPAALKEMTMVTEGYPTAKSAYQLTQKYGCDCPIITEIYQVLYEGKAIRESVQDLLSRPVHEESESEEWLNGFSPTTSKVKPFPR
ncbi:MAG: NAD(P)-dependent glycerol-3-phosphate dehydrogenase [Elusimicrobia bacterium]|nr:NAD(P)-dependent glycerol-3-phosphate dehydrogenase [Elusimicrobiota bacterium]